MGAQARERVRSLFTAEPLWGFTGAPPRGSPDSSGERLPTGVGK
jgi:hypothetical protein